MHINHKIEVKVITEKQQQQGKISSLRGLLKNILQSIRHTSAKRKVVSLEATSIRTIKL